MISFHYLIELKSLGLVLLFTESMAGYRQMRGRCLMSKVFQSELLGMSISGVKMKRHCVGGQNESKL